MGGRLRGQDVKKEFKRTPCCRGSCEAGGRAGLIRHPFHLIVMAAKAAIHDAIDDLSLGRQRRDAGLKIVGAVRAGLTRAGQNEMRIAEALLPERILGIPNGDVDVGCAEGDFCG